MKKEEQQKNKSDEKISFFEGAEKTGEVVGFFGVIKKVLQNISIFRKPEKGTRGLLMSSVDDKKIGVGGDVKNKNISKKDEAVRAVNSLVKEEDFAKTGKAESKKATSARQAKNVPNWSASNILSTNLIKGESTLTYHWDRKIVILLVNILLVIAVIGLAYSGLLYWEKRGKIANVELDLRANDLKVRTENLKKEAEEINLFNKKIALAKGLFDRHVYWDNFFEFLEKNILSDIYLENSFSGGTDGEYVFRAYTKDLKTMLDQVNYLRQADKRDMVLSAEIADVVVGGDAGNSQNNNVVNEKQKVSFYLILKINKNIFYKK